VPIYYFCFSLKTTIVLVPLGKIKKREKREKREEERKIKSPAEAGL
jgi:hypothetical protein